MSVLLKNSEVLIKVTKVKSKYFAYQIETNMDWTDRIQTQMLRKAYQKNKLIRWRNDNKIRCFEILKDKHTITEKIIDIKDIADETKIESELKSKGIEFCDE